jgi:O-antigen/teichoic acid export membrane protein
VTPPAGRPRLRAPGPLLANAASLFGSTVVTSLLGFAFWGVAARMLPVAAVGRASAAVSAVQLLSVIGILGLGTLLVGELAAVEERSGLIVAVLALASGTSCLLGAGYALFAQVVGLDIGDLAGLPWGVVIIGACTALTTAGTVLDYAAIGVLRGGLQFWRNAAFALFKLLLLPALVLLLADDERTLLLAWTFGVALSFGTLWLHARRGGAVAIAPPAWHLVHRLRGAAATHHWLNLAANAPRLVLPGLVVVFLGPELNGAFYAALLISSFVSIVPVHLSTALFAIGKGERERLRRELRTSLAVSGVVAVGAVAGTLLLGRPVLALLGPDYRQAAGALVLLVVAALPFAVSSHYVAVQRVRGRLVRAAVVVSLAGVAEVAAAAVGAAVGESLTAVALGYLLAQLLTALVVLAPVLSAAGWGRPRVTGRA